MKINSPFYDYWVGRLVGKLQRSLGIGSGAFDCANEVDAIAHLLEKNKYEISSEKLILDVGGNLGGWTRESIQRWPNSEVVIFEPSKAALNKLESRYAGVENVKVVPKALSDSIGSATLFSDVAGSGLGSLSERDLGYIGINFSHTETVQVDTLDNYLRKIPKPIAILKIDVEGYELAVLQGATDLFTSNRKPIIVQFEFGGACIDTRIYFRDLWKFFEKYEYDLFRIGKRKLHKIVEYREELETFKTTNIIAIRRTR